MSPSPALLNRLSGTQRAASFEMCGRKILRIEVVIGQTTFQVKAGVVFSRSQFIGMIEAWVGMGSIAIGFVLNMLRNLTDDRLSN